MNDIHHREHQGYVAGHQHRHKLVWADESRWRPMVMKILLFMRFGILVSAAVLPELMGDTYRGTWYFFGLIVLLTGLTYWAELYSESRSEKLENERRENLIKFNDNLERLVSPAVRLHKMHIQGKDYPNFIEDVMNAGISLFPDSSNRFTLYELRPMSRGERRRLLRSDPNGEVFRFVWQQVQPDFQLCQRTQKGQLPGDFLCVDVEFNETEIYRNGLYLKHFCGRQDRPRAEILPEHPEDLEAFRALNESVAVPYPNVAEYPELFTKREGQVFKSLIRFPVCLERRPVGLLEIDTREQTNWRRDHQAIGLTIVSLLQQGFELEYLSNAPQYITPDQVKEKWAVSRDLQQQLKSANTYPTLLQVVRYIVGEQPHGMSALQLHRLVYFAHGTHLVITGQPLFNDGFEAWRYGPACKKLWQMHKGKSNVTLDDFTESKLQNIERDLCNDRDFEDLDSVYKEFLHQFMTHFARYSGEQLHQVAVQHRRAWWTAYESDGLRNLDGRSNAPIQNDSIRRDFRQLVKLESGAGPTISTSAQAATVPESRCRTAADLDRDEIAAKKRVFETDPAAKSEPPPF